MTPSPEPEAAYRNDSTRRFGRRDDNHLRRLGADVRARHALAHPRHRHRRRHRRRIRRRVLGVGAGLVRAAGVPVERWPCRCAISATRSGSSPPSSPRWSSASRAPPSSRRWSRPACRRSSAACGAWTRCCPASSRAPPRSWSSRSRCIGLWSFPVLAIAAVASAAAAWIHDWVLYYAEVDPVVQSRPLRLHGDLGRRDRRRWIRRPAPFAQARRRARRIPRLTTPDRQPGVARGPQPLDRPSRLRSAGPRRRLVRPAGGPHDARRGAIRVRQEHARARASEA